MKADDTTPLGRTGLRVSRLGLGLASLGGMFEAVPVPRALAAIDRAWSGGVRLFADNIGLFSHPVPPAVWADLKTAGLLPRSGPTP